MIKQTHRLGSLLALSTALAFSSMSMAAPTNRTEATIVGAAVGGVIGSATGNDLNSTLIGAAVGGLTGNAIALNNQRQAQKNQVKATYPCGYQKCRHSHKSKHGNRGWHLGHYKKK